MHRFLVGVRDRAWLACAIALAGTFVGCGRASAPQTHEREPHVAPPTSSALRSLDWPNRRYKYEGSTIRFRDGEARRGRAQLRLAQVAFGDLTGDGSEEAAALILSSAPTGDRADGVMVVLVYSATPESSEPWLIGRVDGSKTGVFTPDDIAIEHVSIERGELVVTGERARVAARAVYRWSGSALLAEADGER